MTLTDDECNIAINKMYRHPEDCAVYESERDIARHFYALGLAAKEPTLVRCPSCGDEWSKP